MMGDMKLEIKITDKQLYEEDGGTPAHGTYGAAALDLRSTVQAVIKPGECLPIDTGICIHIGSVWKDYPDDDGDELQKTLGIAAVCIPRSGLGAKKGLILGNSVGLIDEDYQGPVTCYMWNRSAEAISIQRGERIAQMTFIMVFKPTMNIVDEFTANTVRGVHGFGHTGRV